MSFLQQKDEITTFKAVTNDNEALTLVALTVFEDDVSLTVLKDDKEIATLGCRWTNNKRQGLKGDNVYIEVEKKQDNLKNFDLIVLNSATEAGAGFKHDTNQVRIFHKGGKEVQTALLSKEAIAEIILEEVKKVAS